MLADYHLHTEYSDDSTVPMEAYVKKAIDLGFHEICFTDHIDYEIPNIIYANPKACLDNILQLRDKYNGKLAIKFGMEFGMQIHTISQFQKTFDEYPFDFILMSCHCLDNQQLYNHEFQKGKSQKEYNERYYSEILGLVKNYDGYSVLAHLDLIRRYDKIYYGFENTKSYVEEILKEVIKNGKGLEVNTSCHRYKIPDLTPSVEILNLYKNLGGEIITIGSDSHDINQFGGYIAETRKQLKDLGFKFFATFENMKPIMHNIEI